MNRAIMKFLSILLAAALLFTQTGITTLAESSENGELLEFGPLSVSVERQTVPAGTAIDDLELPDMLSVTVMDTQTLEPSVFSLSVLSWQSTPDYDKDTAGVYVFAPVLDAAWQLANGVSLPEITVEVEAALLSGGSIGGFVWHDGNEDGIWDGGEYGIAGFTVSLYDAGDMQNQLLAAVTEADGAYSFDGLEAGDYVLGIQSQIIDEAEYLPPLIGIADDNSFAMSGDWINAYTEPISVQAGGVIAGINAGVRTPPGIEPLAVNVWDGSVATGFASGDGSQGNSYKIATAAQLAYFAQQSASNTYEGKFIELTSDIDLDNRTMTSIGHNSFKFHGTFDGKGHIIKNLYNNVSSSNPYFCGLFGSIGGFGRVQNVGVSGSISVTGTDKYIGLLAGANEGGVSNCYATGSVTANGVRSLTGVLVGYNLGIYGGSGITDCFAIGSANGYSDGNSRAGVLTGYNYSGKVTRCYASGSASGANSGSLIGQNSDSGSSVVNSYWNGMLASRSGGGTELDTVRMTADNTLAGDMSGLGGAFVKRANTVTYYYPELSVFYNSASQDAKDHSQNIAATKKIDYTKAPASSAITYGQTLASSNLTGGDTNGTWVWQSPNTTPAAAGTSNYPATFTLTNMALANLYNNTTATVQISVTVNRAPVTNTAGSGSAVYGGSGAQIDLDGVAGLFTVNPNAGAKTYTIEAGGTGAGSIIGNNLTVTKVGTINIGLATAQTATHDACAKVTAALTVTPGATTLTFPASSQLTYGQTLAGSALTGGSDTLGSFAWADNTIVPVVNNTGYDVVFTPSDLNYDYSGENGWNGGTGTVTRSVSVTVSTAVPTDAVFDYTIQSPIDYDNAPKPATVAQKSGVTGLGAFTVYYEGTGGTIYAKTDAAPTNAGNYEVTAEIAEGDNYQPASLTLGSFTISKINQPTLTIDPVTGKTYGDAAFRLTTSDGGGTGTVAYTVVAGPGTVLGDMLTITGAGTINVTATKAADNNYNEATSSQYQISVSQKALSIAGATHTKPYDGTTGATGVTVTLSGVVTGDTGDVSPNVVTAAYTNSGAGTATIDISAVTLTGAKSGNYTVTPESGVTVAGITKAPISIAAASDPGHSVSPKTYSGDTGATVTAAAFTGLQGLETLTLGADYTAASAAFGDADAGSGKTVTATVSIEQNGTVSKNYSLANDGAAGNLSITGQTINKASANGVNKTVYVSENTAGNYSFDLTELLPSVTAPQQVKGVAYNPSIGANPDGVLGTPSYSGGDTLTIPYNSSLDGETATITVTMTSTNHNITSAAITVEVVAKTIVAISGVTAENGEYDGTPQAGYTGTPAASSGNPAFEYSYSGRPGTTYGPAPNAPINAGDYTLTISVDSGDPNYKGGTTLDFTIDKKSLTITADDKAVTVGSSLPAVTISYSGFISPDDETTVFSSMPAADYAAGTVTAAPGTFAITFTAQAVLNNTAGANYALTHQDGTLTVNAGSGPARRRVGGRVVSTSSYINNANIKTVGDKIIVDLTKGSTILSASQMKEIVRLNATKDIIIHGGGFTITFAKDTMTDPDKDCDFGISFNTRNYYNRITALAGYRFIIQIHFNYNGKLPAEATITFNTGSRHTGKTLEYQYYNQSTGEFEYIQDVTVGENGNVTVRQSSCSDYVLLSKDADVTTTPITPQEPENERFSDIDEHWAKADILFVAQTGLFSGTGDSLFRPNATMTRGMVVTVLGRYANPSVSNFAASRFNDVTDRAYYAPYVEWAAETGIVSGMGDNSFAPDAPVTREQMAVILINFSHATGLSLPEGTSEAAPFTDYEEFSNWAADAICEINKLGIISGRPNGRFDPKGTATRAEVAAMLTRFIKAN